MFLPNTKKLTLEPLQKYQNLDPVIRQLKFWHTYKTKPIKTDITILGNKTLLRYFRKVNKTSINENTNILEYQISELKVLCLPLSKILLAFHISNSLTITDMQDQKAHTQISYKNFYFPNAPIWIKVLCSDCITCQLIKRYPHQKRIEKKTRF